MADPVYPIYPAQEETAAVQKYLADKRAYDALAAQLPAIERKIAAQQKIAETGLVYPAPSFIQPMPGFYVPTTPSQTYDPKAQEQAILSIRNLEAQKAAVVPPDLSAVRQAALASELPSGRDGATAQQQTIQQTAPTPTPAQPTPAPEKPQYDPFAQFSELMRQRDDFRAKAFQYAKQTLPREDWLDAMSIADKYVSERFKAPQNIAQPIIDQFTGKPLEGYALIGGKVEKIEKPKVEEDGRSVIGYEGKAPTQGEAVKFREQVSDINSGVSALDELIQLGMKGSSLSPTDRARAQNLARMIQGKFRVEIVGPGAVTENDRKVLEDVVASPLDIFRLSDVPTLLMDMKSRILSAKNEKAFQLGLTPTGQKQQQQSAPGGVVKAVRMPGGSLTRQ